MLTVNRFSIYWFSPLSLLSSHFLTSPLLFSSMLFSPLLPSPFLLVFSSTVTFTRLWLSAIGHAEVTSWSAGPHTHTDTQYFQLLFFVFAFMEDADSDSIQSILYPCSWRHVLVISVTIAVCKPSLCSVWLVLSVLECNVVCVFAKKRKEKKSPIQGLSLVSGGC